MVMHSDSSSRMTLIPNKAHHLIKRSLTLAMTRTEVPYKSLKSAPMLSPPTSWKRVLFTSSHGTGSTSTMPRVFKTSNVATLSYDQFQKEPSSVTGQSRISRTTVSLLYQRRSGQRAARIDSWSLLKRHKPLLPTSRKTSSLALNMKPKQLAPAISHL